VFSDTGELWELNGSDALVPAIPFPPSVQAGGGLAYSLYGTHRQL